MRFKVSSSKSVPSISIQQLEAMREAARNEGGGAGLGMGLGTGMGMGQMMSQTMGANFSTDKKSSSTDYIIAHTTAFTPIRICQQRI
jgi:membrane protease subunit (stomatin/prohibitin family)